MYEKRYNHVPKKLLHFPRACFLGKLFPFIVFYFYNDDKPNSFDGIVKCISESAYNGCSINRIALINAFLFIEYPL